MRILFLMLLVLVSNLSAGEPDFKILKPIRTVNSIGILGDIESHLKSGNPYTNGNTQIETSVHEGTHGLNSFVRNSSIKYNGFYVLEDRYVQIWEPKITLDDVAKNIPISFRTPSKFNGFAKHVGGTGKVFPEDGWHLKDWKNQPLYIIDEWIAYTHGCMYFDEVKQYTWTAAPTYLIDQTVFSFALLKSLPTDYQYKQELTDFVVWNTKRVKIMVPKFDTMIERLSIFVHSEDCKDLYKFSETLMGDSWHVR